MLPDRGPRSRWVGVALHFLGVQVLGPLRLIEAGRIEPPAAGRGLPERLVATLNVYQTASAARDRLGTSVDVMQLQLAGCATQVEHCAPRQLREAGALRSSASSEQSEAARG